MAKRKLNLVNLSSTLTELFNPHGVPAFIPPDNGPGFMPRLWGADIGRRRKVGLFRANLVQIEHTWRKLQRSAQG